MPIGNHVQQEVCAANHERQVLMKLLAVVKNPVSITRYLAAAGELTDVPSRSPGRGPPYWKSRVLKRLALGDENQCGDHGSKGDEAA